MLLKHFAYRRLGLSTGKTVDRLSVLEHHHSRQTSNPKLLRDTLLLIGVDLGQQKRTRVFIGEFFQEGHQLLTRRAPISPKIDHHGAIEGFVNQILLRIVLVNVNYVHNILGYDSPKTSDIV